MTTKLMILVILLFVSIPAFAQSVDTAWVRRYNGPGNGWDFANAIAVDGSGNVYVTGQSMGSGTYDDYATLKYDPSGNELWVRRYYELAYGLDGASAITVDGYGNVYVTGSSYIFGSGTTFDDYATIKYYPNGDTAWVRRYNGPTNSYDDASDIAVDASGNVYVTGRSAGGGGTMDYATIKYYPNGGAGWEQRYTGYAGDQAYAIAVDDSGNVYVTGYSEENIWPRSDYATIKYYSNGDTAWVRRYNGPGNGSNYAYAIAVDHSGYIYVTGSSYGGSGTGVDYATIKYYPNGDTVWVRRYNGPGNSGDMASAIAVDDSGYVYVTGLSYNSATTSDADYATIKYYPNGDTAWVRRYNGPGNDYDEASDIAIDDSGNVYVTGRSWDSVTRDDYATIKYYLNGDTAWVKRYKGSENSLDLSNAIAVDGSGNVYVTGESGDDYATIKYVQFLRGDVNRDGVVDIEDAVYLINYLYINGLSPIPIIQVGDANCNRAVDLGDVVYLISYVYRGGPAPCN